MDHRQITDGKQAANSVHNHPNSILSGVYYVQAPEHSGVISFQDPRSAAQMLIPPVTEFKPLDIAQNQLPAASGNDAAVSQLVVAWSRDESE